MTSGVLTGALKTERGTCRDDMDLRLVGIENICDISFMFKGDCLTCNSGKKVLEHMCSR
jgi:hypothetical protein